MKINKKSFRKTEISKVCGWVAICGFVSIAPNAFADWYNLNDFASPSSITAPVDTNSIGVYYNNGNDSWHVNPTRDLTITLNPGIDLGGQTIVGGTPFAVFTTWSADDNYYFSNSSQTTTLNLRGNNQITGLVGVHSLGDSTYTLDPLSVINLQGSDITFNSDIYAQQINFTQGGTAQFYGNVGGTAGTPSSSVTTSLNYNGNEATVTLHNGVTITGNITNTSTNGTLIFESSGTVTGNIGDETTSIGLIQVKGNNSVVKVGGGVSTDRLDYQANATVAVNGTLDLNNNLSPTAFNGVNFNGYSGAVLQVGQNIVGIEGKAAISTTLAGTGALTMLSGANQVVTGNIGSSVASINTLNIGGVNSGVGYDTSDNVSSTTTVHGDVFAQTIRLNNNDLNSALDSTLIMASGYSIKGNIYTELGQNQRGNLTLLGGAQIVDGAVGASGASLNTVTSGAGNSTFTGAIYAKNVTNDVGTGVSTYQGNVYATNVGVNAGTSNFEQSLSATKTTISTGTGNFNRLGGTTSSDIDFTGTGVANLYRGLTGVIAFKGGDATVNLWDTRSVVGAITTTASGTGIVNALGAGSFTGNIGADGLAINQLNINTQGSSSKTVNVNGHIYANTVSLQNDGELVLAAGKNLTGTVVTSNNGTGTLTLSGASTVTGDVGAAGLALRSISAGAGNVTFNNGVVYANTLTYSGDNTVRFNGNLSKSGASFIGDVPGNLSSTPDLGFVGTVDFTNVGVGTFTLGDSVDLITAHAATGSKTIFTNANGASLVFAGNSVVVGDLGSSANSLLGTNNENFQEIYAGADGSAVTFLGKVYVRNNTFNVSGTGTVNFLDDLTGNLLFNADGTVNVASGKNLNDVVTTYQNGKGTLNFVGSATTRAPIGADVAMLKAVNFHPSTSSYDPLIFGPDNSAIINIGHDVYALTTTIGTGSGFDSVSDKTIANITANVFLGDALTLAGPGEGGSNVTLNTAGTVYSSAVSPVDFAHTKNANGTLTNSATVTQSTTGFGAITTNGATLNFAIATAPWASNAGGNVSTVASASSRITGGEGSTLVMNGSETVNLSLLGSLRDGQSHTLVDVTGLVFEGNTSLPGTLNDNSYVIDTALTRTNGDSGSLVMTASRAADVYITKGLNADHFSNPAALRLGTLAAAGTSYSSDIQTVLNKLDIDQWGFGNNQANLAVQAQRLAPIANNSVGLSTFRMASMVSDSIGMRMQELRIPETAKAYEAKDFWIRSMYQRGKESSVAGYDGFKSDISGFTMGLDTHPNRDSIVGVALSYSNAKIKQQDFRAGDQATVNGWNLSLYGAYDITKEWFIDGIVTGSNMKLDSQRTAVVGRVAKADPDINQVTGKLDMGYRFKFSNSATTLTPIISLEGSTLKQNAYQETGAGDIGLSVASQRLNWTQSGVGLRLATVSSWGGLVAKPELTVMAQHQAGNFAKPISAQFIGDNTAEAVFQTAVADKGAYSSNSVRATLGLGLLMSKTSSLSLRYDYSKSDSFKSNAAELFARWDF